MFDGEKMNIDAHFATAGGLRGDGMNYLSANNALQSGGPSAGVALQPVANAQQTPSYLTANQLSAPPNNSNVAGANFHALTPHVIATSTTGGLPLQTQHSQGPTPSNTPPAPPNDPKSNLQYPHPNFNVMYTTPAYRPTANMQFACFPPRTQNTRGMQPHMAVRNGHQQFYVSYPSGHPGNIQPYYMNNNPTTIGQLPVYPVSSNESAQFVLVTQNNATPQNYSNNYRGSTGNYTNNIRANQQSMIPVHGTSTSNVPPVSAVYSPSIPLPPMPPQPTNNKQPKKRSHAVAIINPATNEEISVAENEEEIDNKITNNVKNPEGDRIVEEFAAEVNKRASEPSNRGTFTSTKFVANKEPITTTTAAAISTEQNVSSYTPAVQQTTAGNFNLASENTELVTNALKTPNVTCVALPEMDYKRPTRENQNVAVAAAAASTVVAVSNESQLSDAVKPLEKSSSIPTWPETTVNFTSVQPAPQRTVAPVVVKTIPKESVNAITSSSFGSSPSPGSVSTTIPSHTAFNDGLNKAATVTNNSVVLSDSNEVSKKVTKQGIQSGVLPASVVEEAASSITSAKETVPVKPSVTIATAANQPLPQLSQSTTLTATAPSPAQINVTKLDNSKSLIVSQSSATQSSTTVTANVISSQNPKPPTSALHTSGPNSDKPSPIATQPAPFGQPPFPQKSTAVNSVVNQTQAGAEKVIKEEKSNPSKSRNRGKESDVDSVNVDQNVSASKTKSAQPFPKHQNSEAKQVVTIAPQSVVSPKQTNGETTETQTPAEGNKSKKNKKSSKKEINKKGSDKEGSDMDMFTNIDKSIITTEKTRNSEKIIPPNSSSIAVNSTTNNRSKTNSSQKSVEESKENASVAEPVEKVNFVNIPPPVALKIKNSDIKKTEEKPSDVYSGVRKYSTNFLLDLRYRPECRRTVHLEYTSPNLFDPNAQIGFGRSMSQNGYMAGNAFLPNFFPGSKNMAPVPPRNKSQQGSLKRDRPNQIHLSLSLREDVPLRQTKDAWKPARFNPDLKTQSPDEKKTADLYKKVKSILNKLTPEKFDTLIQKIKDLSIDTNARLQGVIDQIFEKAIDEPGFCKCYAEMCRVMQETQVHDEEEGKKTFRTLLINKCQQQFQRNKSDELDAAKNKAEMDDCTDLEKKKELQLQYEEIERKIRRRSVGNCRFIGELFKLQMLTAKIMTRCVAELLQKIEEESLECLCKLLTTIGKDIEAKVGAKDLDQYFNKMQEISEKKSYKVSSRIRFMLQDVIDLRKNAWIPRREADNPKTIGQINMELDKKEAEMKWANMVRKDDFNRNSKDFRKGGTRTGSQNEDDWKTVQTKTFHKTSNYKLEPHRFNNVFDNLKQDVSDTEVLGTARSFSMWSKGANSKLSDKKNPLDSMDKQPRMINASTKSHSTRITPSSSLEKARPYSSAHEANDSSKMPRSSSTQNVHLASRDNSSSRSSVPSRNASQSAPSPGPEILSSDKIKICTKTILDEFNNTNDLTETVLSFEVRFNPKQMSEVIEAFMLYVLEIIPNLATKCGQLFAALYKKKILLLQPITDGLSPILENASDLVIDCPKLWTILGDMISELFIEDRIQYSEFEAIIVSRHPDQRNGELLKAVSNKINNSKKAAVDKLQPDMLKEFLLGNLINDTFENTSKWLDENVENSRNNTNLVHALTTAVCEICHREYGKVESHDNKEDANSENDKVINKLFNKYKRFFILYIDNKEELEMQCLMAVLEFMDKVDFPGGFLLAIFEALYDLNLISSDSFVQWKNNCNSTKRKGVALLSLNSFYEFINDRGNENQSS